MRLLTWNQSYVTGIDAIDASHRKLVAKINRLHEELDSDKRTVLAFFRELEKEVERHFRQEEALMRSHACAEYDDHKRDHDRLRDDISDLAEVLCNAIEIDSVELSLRLDAWFGRHFRARDSQLGNLVAAMK